MPADTPDRQSEPPADAGDPGRTRELDAMRQLARRLAGEHPERDPAEVERIVQTAFDGFENSAVRDFVPVLVERQARLRLADTGAG